MLLGAMKQLELSLFYKKKNHVTRLYSVKLRSSKHRVVLSGNPPLRPPLDRGPSTLRIVHRERKTEKYLTKVKLHPAKPRTTQLVFFSSSRLFSTLFRHFCFPFTLVVTRGK